MKLDLIAMVLLLSVAIDADAARPKPGGAADFDQRWSAWQQHQKLADATPFAGIDWRDIGPVEQGGRIVDIAAVPGHPYRFYVAYASGGLWRTDNGGLSFEPLSDDWPTTIMGDIAVDPSNPETIWVGTGENNSSRSSYGGLGVFRSDDGGKTWVHKGLGDGDRTGRILVHPDNPDTVYVAMLGKLYTPGGDRGVYRTVDGGESWEQILAGDDWTGVIDLVFKPDDPSTIYAATWDRKRRPWDFTESGDGSGIYRTTNGGDDWSRLDGGLPTGEYVGRIGLATSAAAPDSVFALVDNQEPLPESEWDLGDRPINAKRLKNMTQAEFLSQDPDEIEAFIRGSDLDVGIDTDGLKAMIESGQITLDDLLAELGDANANLFNTDIRGLEIYRSDDSGDRWTKTHDEPVDQVAYTYGYYFGEIRVSPEDADRLYVMGVPIIRSDDGGATWSNINAEHVHVDHHALWIDPDNADHLLLGNDGGLDTSFDGGDTWTKLDAQPVGQFYTVNVDMAEPYNVYGGLQDNGTIKCSSTNDWKNGGRCERINGGDGMYVAIDPRDNKTVFTGFQFGYYSKINGGRSEVRPRDKFGEEALRYNWNTPVILSAHNADIVYFGANRLFRSFNQGQDWTAISPDLTVSDNRGDVPYATMTTVSESPLEFGLIWIGTDDGQVRITEDGGRTWRDVADRLPRDRWVSRVEASPHNVDRAFVSMTGYRDDDIKAYVYRTDDRGKKWRDISANLPAEAVNVIREDPLVPDLLYLGTDRSVYVSTDGGDQWQVLGDNLPHVPVHDLVIHPRDRELVIGTHGRSVWIADVLALQDWAESESPNDLALYYIDPVQASRGWRSEPSRWWDREDRQPEVEMAFHAASDSPVQFEVIDGNDNPVASWDVDASPGINRTRWNLLVDRELALAAERASIETADEPPGDLSAERLSESARLGHKLYILPGKYTVEISQDGKTASQELEIKAPKGYEPRKKPAFEVRGRK